MKSKNNRKLVTAAMAALVLLLLQAPVFAQGGAVQNHYGQELATTDDLIRHARNMIKESGIDKGLELLNMAVELQNQAHNLGTLRRYESGLRFTLRARDKARQAITVNRQASENENLVQRQLERTDNLIGRFGSAVPSESRPMFESVFTNARENQRLAWEFYHQRQLRPALKLSRQAERTIRNLADQVKARMGQENRLENQLRQAEAELERAATLMATCENNDAAKIYEQARQTFQEGRRLAGDGAPLRAANAIRQARQLMRRLPELCDETSGREHLNRMVEQLRRDLDISGPFIRDSGDNRAVKFLETALEHLNEADQACDSGQEEVCAANIKAAQINFQKAKKLAGM